MEMMSELKSKSLDYAENFVKRNPQYFDSHALLRIAYIDGALDALKIQWRSVNEELPPKMEMVFVLRGVGSVPETAFHKGDGDFTTYECSDAVTHWMPIPELTK